MSSTTEIFIIVFSLIALAFLNFFCFFIYAKEIKEHKPSETEVILPKEETSFSLPQEDATPVSHTKPKRRYNRRKKKPTVVENTTPKKKSNRTPKQSN